MTELDFAAELERLLLGGTSPDGVSLEDVSLEDAEDFQGWVFIELTRLGAPPKFTHDTGALFARFLARVGIDPQTPPATQAAKALAYRAAHPPHPSLMALLEKVITSVASAGQDDKRDVAARWASAVTGAVDAKRAIGPLSQEERQAAVQSRLAARMPPKPKPNKG